MNHLHFLKKLTILYIFLFAIFYLFISFVAQPFQIKGASMHPSLKEGNLVLINKIPLLIRGDIHKGDIVAFVPPLPGDEFLIKRVAASPGDTLSTTQSAERRSRCISKAISETAMEMGKNEFYMIGDNVEESIDSRAFGTVRKENIIGKALIVIWPLNEIKLLHHQNLESVD